MSKQFSSDLKMKAVKYYHKVDNYSKVCKIFECSERSLKRWVEKYEINKTLERKKREEGSYKIKKEHIQFIKETLKKDNTITMEQLHKLTIDKFKNLDISRQYLSDIIRDNNITRKRATFKHFPKTYRGEPRNENEELKMFFKEIKKYNLDDIISIDETSISTSLSINYCREELGKRCIIKTDDNEVFKKYSLVVAINNKKCIDYKLYEQGAVNSIRFNDFLIEICKNVKNKLFILDNGQIHKKEETKKIIKDSGNFLLYTIPYHPRLNAIEQWFNQVKHYIKLDKPSTFIKLKESLSNSILKIKIDNYKNYFIYAYNKEIYKKNSKKSSKYKQPKIYKN
jgi:transposase